MFDRAFKRVNTFVDFRIDLVEGSSKRLGDELEQEVTKKQKVDDVQETTEVDDDKKTTKIKELMKIVFDEEEVAIDVIPLATKPPIIVDWKIHKEGKKNYYQIIRADGSSKMYLVFSHMLKSFDMEDFETLVWKNQQDYRVLEWKLYDSCGVHFLRMQHMQIYMLVEKRYPLTPAIITDMLNKKLQFNAAEGVNAASEEVSTAELVSTAYVQTPSIPFPRSLRKEKEEAQQRKFLENLKQLHINLPFIKALAQILKYAKFLKGLLTNKAGLEDACKITMNERCSAVLLNKLPSKEKDLGSFTIPRDIGKLHINNALADLGASISLMPYKMYEKLGLGEPTPTRMSLELADRSIQYPRGVIKHVLIKVDKFVLPIDFIILDMPEDSRVPIILGRPFLATARVMIDVFNKKITLRVGDDEVIFSINQSIKRPPNEDDECYGIDDLYDIETLELLENDRPDSFLLKGLEKSIDQSDLESCESLENKSNDESNLGIPIRRIDSVNTPYSVE
ncbi:DNA-directed DNA polymerase [Tanacetum coccineum]